MDKSGRKTLAENLKRITEAADSRRSWAMQCNLDTKAVERAEKDEGEKGVSLQALDDLAAGLKVRAWQLLVPGFDRDEPPQLSTEPRPQIDLASALRVVQQSLMELSDEMADRAGEALRLLALRPDSEKGFANALDALNPTHGQDLPLRSVVESEVATPVRYDTNQTSPASPRISGALIEGDKQWHSTSERKVINKPRTDQRPEERRPGGAKPPAQKKRS